MKLQALEEDIINVAITYKKTLCKLVRDGKESNLLDLLHDDSENNFPVDHVLDYAKENLDMDKRFIIHVHFCLSLLDKNSKQIIWKEYFLRENYETSGEWWRYNYARSTFYRLRNKAIKEFHALCCE